MMGRIIGSLIFFGLIIGLEFYVFSGFKALFKSGMPRWFKWTYWLLVLIPFAWMFIGPMLQVRWLNNLMIGVFLTLFVSKLFFALFLIIEDLYRFLKLGVDYAQSSADRPASLNGRRKFMAQIGLGIAAIPFFSFLYGVTRGKYAFTVHQQQIAFPDLPEAFDGLRILQISDVHSGSFDSMAAVERGLEMVQAQQADIILFTGDLVNHDADEILPYVPLFQKLEAPLGKFSVLGNHDYGYFRNRKENPEAIANMEKLESHQKAMGFHLLKNDSLKLQKGGQYIRLAGVENWGKGPFPKEGDLEKTFADCEADEFTILLSHDPSHWTAHVIDFPRHIHLTLSGHTHGMQFGIEIPGFKWSPIKYRYPQWAGLYTAAKQHLYVNRGFGFLGFAGRVGILPEITVIELKKG